MIILVENVRFTPGHEASDSRTYEVDSEEQNKKKDNTLADGGELKNLAWHEEARFNLSSMTRNEEELSSNRNESSENFEQNKSEVEVNENYVSSNRLEKEDISNELVVLYNKINDLQNNCDQLTQLINTLTNKQNVHLHLIGHLWQMIQVSFQQNQQPQNNFTNIQRPSNTTMFANNSTSGLNMQNTIQPIRLWAQENIQNLFSNAGTSSSTHNSQIGLNGASVENETLNKVRQDTNVSGGNSELKSSTMQMSNGKHVAMWNAIRENNWQVFNRQQEVFRIQTRNQNNEQEAMINKHLDVPVSSNIYAVKETISKNYPISFSCCH